MVHRTINQSVTNFWSFNTLRERDGLFLEREKLSRCRFTWFTSRYCGLILAKMGTVGPKGIVFKLLWAWKKKQTNNKQEKASTLTILIWKILKWGCVFYSRLALNILFTGSLFFCIDIMLTNLWPFPNFTPIEVHSGCMAAVIIVKPCTRCPTLVMNLFDAVL